MAVHVTARALEVIRGSLELGGLDPQETGVRLRMAGGQVRPRFSSEPGPDDEVVEVEGVRLFVAPEVSGESGDVEIDVEPEHETLLVRPAT